MEWHKNIRMNRTRVRNTAYDSLVGFEALAGES